MMFIIFYECRNYSQFLKVINSNWRKFDKKFRTNCDKMVFDVLNSDGFSLRNETKNNKARELLVWLYLDISFDCSMELSMLISSPDMALREDKPVAA